MDDTVAAQSELLCNLAVAGRVVPAHYAFAAVGKPPCLSGEIRLQATSADGSGASSSRREKQARTGSAVRGAMDADHRRQDTGFSPARSLIPGFEDLFQFPH